MRRLFAWVSPCLLFVGCATIEDCHYSFVNEYRANVAWYASDYDKHQVRCFSDFGYGWRMGYFDVSMGRFGRTPPIPPKKYWKASYQAGDGPAAINAWYQGYQAGAIAAERDGYGALHALPAYGAGGHAALSELPYSEGVIEPGPSSLPASPIATPEEVSPPMPPPPPTENTSGAVQGASWTSVYSSGLAESQRRRLSPSAGSGDSGAPLAVTNGASALADDGEAAASSALEPLPPTTLADLPSTTSVVR